MVGRDEPIGIVSRKRISLGSRIFVHEFRKQRWLAKRITSIQKVCKQRFMSSNGFQTKLWFLIDKLIKFGTSWNSHEFP